MSISSLNWSYKTKAVAAACTVVCAAATTPALAFVAAMPPNVDVNSHNLFLGNTGGTNMVKNIDQWDTYGYALSVFDPANPTKFTDYIVQRVQGYGGVGITGPNPGTANGYSIGVLSVIRGTQQATVGNQNPYKFDSLSYFQVNLQNQSSGTINNAIAINNIGDLATGYNVLGSNGLSYLADPTSATGGVYGTNSGYTFTTSVYQGAFLQENYLTANPGFCVPDPAGTCQPFMQSSTAGQSIFDYIASLVPPSTALAQMSNGNIGTPDQSVLDLVNDGTRITNADVGAAATLIYNLFNSLGEWDSPIDPTSPGWIANTTVYTVAADPVTDFARNVPEPATLALVGLSLLGLGAVRRRQVAG